MTKLTVSPPVVGTKDSVAEPAVGTALTTIETWANGQIDSSNIKAEGVEGKAVNKEIPKVTGANYGTLTARATGAKYLASATRPTWVTVNIKNEGAAPTTELEILVNTILIAKFTYVAKTESTVPYSFLVPAALEWEPKIKTGTFSVESSYLVL